MLKASLKVKEVVPSDLVFTVIEKMPGDPSGTLFTVHVIDSSVQPYFAIFVATACLVTTSPMKTLPFLSPKPDPVMVISVPMDPSVTERLGGEGGGGSPVPGAGKPLLVSSKTNTFVLNWA